ncbi:MAG TPA: SufE family protein [Fibrobacteraceae bacterium]|nr:SufE family protein [Fibrobacteraceae bacterium]
MDQEKIPSIAERENEIRGKFATFQHPDDKWKWILQLAREHPGMDPRLRDEKFLVKGCAARMFLVPEFRDGVLWLHMDTEAGDENPLFSRGLGALALHLYHKQKPSEILKARAEFFQDIGLQVGLSPSRANGFASLLRQIGLYAQVYARLEATRKA